MSHKKRCTVNWSKVDEDIRTQSMAYLGLIPPKNPFRCAPQIGAEWETHCRECGIKVIYCTADENPNLAIELCPYCKESRPT